jgi:hypothetical protein
MAKKTMSRRGSDNVYLHRDFHGALSAGIDYLDQNFGEEAVREYLRRFTRSFYAPLIEDVKRRGLVALNEQFEKVYATEGGEVEITCSDSELVVRVRACPAVKHMREHGYPVARLFLETTRTVGQALCEGTPIIVESLQYDHETGRSVQRFTRRAQ